MFNCRLFVVTFSNECKVNSCENKKSPVDDGSLGRTNNIEHDNDREHKDVPADSILYALNEEHLVSVQVPDILIAPFG
jgi:hypothetical protein